ncbi:MAG: hypothetical protein E7Z86_09875 [Methanosphaera stadtmanae]|nr:hypothetical protein [Methanosphaera stadtmanae]
MTKQTKVHIVYCHPYAESMTGRIKTAYIKALRKKNISYTLSDLYKQHFTTDLTKREYLRESGYLDIKPPKDVLKQQKLINDADILTFIFPLFWMDAPSKLVGYFSRVFTRGFRYENDDSIKTTMKRLKQVNFLIVAGSSYDDLQNDGKINALKTVFIDDRISKKTRESKMYLFTDTAPHKINDKLINKYIRQADKIGRNTPTEI